MGECGRCGQTCALEGHEDLREWTCAVCGTRNLVSMSGRSIPMMKRQGQRRWEAAVSVASRRTR